MKSRRREACPQPPRLGAHPTALRAGFLSARGPHHAHCPLSCLARACASLCWCCRPSCPSHLAGLPPSLPASLQPSLLTEMLRQWPRTPVRSLPPFRASRCQASSAINHTLPAWLGLRARSPVCVSILQRSNCVRSLKAGSGLHASASLPCHRLPFTLSCLGSYGWKCCLLTPR